VNIWKGEGNVNGVSNHTEVNFRVVIDRHINLFLRFSWSSVISWWTIVRNNFNSFFNQLVTFVFKAFSVAIFTSIDATAEIIILRWRRDGSERLLVLMQQC
jgi:hypothetical protein